VYISNATPDEIARLFDDRIASRLVAGTAFEVAGPDRRVKTEV
jgi:chromosomal replication initiation ATPase DnaA